jgi:hypothetical protein
MMTTAVWILLAAAVVAVVYAVAASVLGARTAFLTICWVPVAGLLTAVALHHHLGYSGIAALGVTIAASAGLASLGGRLIAKARREKPGTGSLIAATIVAAVPLALAAGWAMSVALSSR